MVVMFGVKLGTSLAVAMIGQLLPRALGLVTTHAVKQVEQLPSDQGMAGLYSFCSLSVTQYDAQRDVLVGMTS